MFPDPDRPEREHNIDRRIQEGGSLADEGERCDLPGMRLAWVDVCVRQVKEECVVWLQGWRRCDQVYQEEQRGRKGQPQQAWLRLDVP